MNAQIFCQIAQCEIPNELCLEQQDEVDCRGCCATTRRCTYCHCLNGIEDPAKGLCLSCAEESKRLQKVDETPDPDAVLTHVELCSAIVNPETVTLQSNLLARWAAHESHLGFDPMLNETAKLRDILLQHTSERGGVRIVNAIPILRVRVRLTDPEIEVAIEELIKTGWFSRTKKAGELIVLCEPAKQTPPFVDQELDAHTGQRTKKQRKPGKDKVQAMIPTLRELSIVLKGRVRMFRGQKIASGIVPWLCATYEITEQNAIAGLEVLKQYGIIKTPDNWRSIILLEGMINSEDPAFTRRERATSRHTPRPV